jgi:arylsulfatase A-like enzyme
MFEGGSRVPLAAYWPGHTPAGKVNNDLIDFSDFFATLADIAGAKLPHDLKLDSHSFAPQIEGKRGMPRDWVYVELNGNSYVRDAKFKLKPDGEMFDLSEAPFKEIPVPRDDNHPEVAKARKKLEAVLADHKALAGHPVDKQQKKQKRQREKKRAKRLQEAGRA